MNAFLKNVIAVVVIAILASPSTIFADELSLAEVTEIAEEGYIYGLPIVMNYAVMYEYCVDKNSPEYKAPFNTIRNEARVFTYKDTAVVTPNSDTPYSMLWLDLRQEPVVLSVPAVSADRYYSVMLCDGNTFNYGYIGQRATGSMAGDYLVVGPNWKGDTPKGVRKVFHSTTQFSAVVFRTQLFNPQDMPNVVKIQSGYKAQPLSSYLKTAPPKPAPAIDFPKINGDLAKTKFWDFLAFSLQFAPPAPEEVKVRERIMRLLDRLNNASPEVAAAVAAGMKAGDSRIKEFLGKGTNNINGWGVSSPFGNRDFYNGNWLLRAAAASAGIYGNDAVEAMYPMCKSLANGELLDGKTGRYQLTFPAGQLPPVNAFWSVTIYDGKTQLLIKNPIDRYLINSPMLPELKKNSDGSITIWIQKDSPGVDRESNWLPAPDGPIYIVMRLYWPKTTEPSILPAGMGTWSPPAIERVK